MRSPSQSHSAVQVHISASTQAAYFLTPLMANIACRGVRIQETGGEMWSLQVLIPRRKWHPRAERRLRDACARLSRYFGQPSVPVMQVTDVSTESRPTRGEKRFFRPFPATRRVAVSPPDRTSPTRPGQSLLLLELDKARGSGIHPATRCCLRLLERLTFQQDIGRALDVETGTGILSMAAARFGVARTLALDREPRAVKVARKNVRRNQLCRKVTVSCRDVSMEGGTYPLVMVQFAPRVLEKRRPQLECCLASGGWLILGGIWWKRRHQVLTPLLDRLRWIDEDREAWWGAVLLRKPPS